MKSVLTIFLKVEGKPDETLNVCIVRIEHEETQMNHTVVLYTLHTAETLQNDCRTIKMRFLGRQHHWIAILTLRLLTVCCTGFH